LSNKQNLFFFTIAQFSQSFSWKEEEEEEKKEDSFWLVGCEICFSLRIEEIFFTSANTNGCFF